MVSANHAALIGVRKLRGLNACAWFESSLFKKIACWVSNGTELLRGECHDSAPRLVLTGVKALLRCFELYVRCALLRSFQVVHLVSLSPRTHGWIMPRKPSFRSSVPLKIITSLRETYSVSVSFHAVRRRTSTRWVRACTCRQSLCTHVAPFVPVFRVSVVEKSHSASLCLVARPVHICSSLGDHSASVEVNIICGMEIGLNLGFSTLVEFSTHACV